MIIFSTLFLALIVFDVPVLERRMSYAGPPKRHPASHVIRFTATLTFDGKPVEFDELLDCRVKISGTPTSPSYIAFNTGRPKIATETPDGGMIMFRYSRNICLVHGDTWGNALPEVTLSDGWTPVLDWYDHRDPREAQTGIIYMSETAIEAPDGRLKIIEPFRISIPEHPASDALIAEAARQAKERDFWLGYEPTVGERYAFTSRRRMDWMFRIPESEWRNPERTIRAFAFAPNLYPPKEELQPTALADYLDTILPGEGAIALGSPGLTAPEPAWIVLRYLLLGRNGSHTGAYFYGIPRRSHERFGLLISDETAQMLQRTRNFPGFFDEYVPFNCIDGVMTPNPNSPGLIYWFREPCGPQGAEVDFLGKRFEGQLFHRSENLILDRDNGDLWWFDSN